jgi:hypothetical protein
MAAIKALTPAAWLKLIASHADSLKSAGVVRLRLGDCEIEFQRQETIVLHEKAGEEESEGDAADAVNQLPRFPRFDSEEGN